MRSGNIKRKKENHGIISEKCLFVVFRNWKVFKPSQICWQLVHIFCAWKISDIFRCVSISITAKFTNKQTDRHTLSSVQDWTGQDWSRQVGTGQEIPGQVRIGQDWSGQVRKYQDRSGHTKTGQDRSGLIRTGQDRSEHSRIEQDRSGQATTDKARSGKKWTGLDRTYEYKRQEPPPCKGWLLPR